MIEWLFKRTKTYKHLNELYEQVLKEYEFYYGEYERKSELYANSLVKIRKIRSLVNKLDKKNQNVKEIKKLIKEVL